jgi:pimeloyl-ACP methyl ester carboxylesterase
MPFINPLVAAGIAGAVLAGTLSAPALAAPTDTVAAPIAWAEAADTTSALEKKRVDSVKTPKLSWYKCYRTAECTTARLPLDYDRPKGATTELGILRIKARKPQSRIGSLFVNPGGPGGSATYMASVAPFFLSDEVLDRFDVVGIDPRGVDASQDVKCFKSHREQSVALDGLNVAFPYTKNEEAAYIKSAKALGKGCSTTGKPLSGAMSTAEVARDMDVIRRAVGDEKLTFLGFSYGSALGQYYANMFPDRVRAIAVDGVIDPTKWVGNSRTQNVIQDDRLRSSDGAYKALKEILIRCDAAGEKFCPFAEGDPVKNFDIIAQRLRAKPLVVDDPALGPPFTITYADFVGTALGLMYRPDAGDEVAYLAADVWAWLAPPSAVANRVEAKARLVTRVAEARKSQSRNFPYDNPHERFSGVACTDGLHPKDASLWPALVAKADKRAPYFGRLWGWGTAQCARNTWTVKDEDAYRGPFTKRTSAPVLVVGNYWDPATNYDEAVASAKLLPNSRLLSSTNWGHTAYGSSTCTTKAMDAYLLRVALPAKGTVCVGERQPFTESLETDPTAPASLDPTAGRVPSSRKALAAADAPARGEKKLLPPLSDIRVPRTNLNGGLR